MQDVRKEMTSTTRPFKKQKVNNMSMLFNKTESKDRLQRAKVGSLRRILSQYIPSKIMGRKGENLTDQYAEWKGGT